MGNLPINSILLAENLTDARNYPEFAPRMVVTHKSLLRLLGRTDVVRVYITPLAHKNRTNWAEVGNAISLARGGSELHPYKVVLLP